MKDKIDIRPAKTADSDSIWDIISRVIRKGDTYLFDPASSKEKMLDFWLSEEKRPYVAVLDGEIVGTFFLEPNYVDRGAHIANAGYMVHPKYEGKGIGGYMAEFSLEEARNFGFHGMQFNMVVKTNTRAIELWQRLGFTIIGEIPDAFKHEEQGLIDAYIMYRKL